MTWVVGYALIGLAVGLYAAVWEYQDGSTPHNTITAGLVWVFTACFWPIVVLVVALGIIANRVARLIGGHR